MMDELLRYLQEEWNGQQPPQTLLETDLTIECFRNIITTPGLDLHNVDRFIRQWRAHHRENKAIPEMWDLFCFKTFKWDEYYVIGHLYLYHKYGLLDEPV